MSTEVHDDETPRVTRLLTIKEVSELTGLKPTRIQSLIREGKGPPTVRIDRYYRVREDKLAKWLDERTHNQKQN